MPNTAHATLKGLINELPTLSYEEKWVLQTILEIGEQRKLEVLPQPVRQRHPVSLQDFAGAPPVNSNGGYGPLRLPPYKLTGRELEVLKNLMSGRSNKETAIQLGISPRTVELHRAHIMEKLEAKSAIQLVDMVRSITGN